MSRTPPPGMPLGWHPLAHALPRRLALPSALARRPSAARCLGRRFGRRFGRRLGGRATDDGQIAVLILGLFVIVLVLILGAIDVTAAQLARMRMLDTADAVALDAADALDHDSAYGGGVEGRPALSDTSVRRSASEHLARTPLPAGIEHWKVVAPTGSPDGGTAVVTVSGRATLPMTGWILESLGGGVTITVTSKARAPLQ